MTGEALFSLEGRVAVVTGALGLLGQQHCQALAAYGATVVVTDLHGDACRAFADSLGGAALGHPLDVTSPASIAALRDTLAERFGRLDVLVNNAALNDRVEDSALALDAVPFERFPLARWRRAFEVNVTGVFLCCQILGAEMARRRRGSVINIASTYALVGPDPALYRRPDGTAGFHKSPAYPATKGAVLAFTRYLAAQWGAAGVRVNALSPGGVQNGQEDCFVEAYARRTPLGRMASARDYEGALVFLASDASTYMTGANLVVDGGWTAW